MLELFYAAFIVALALVLLFDKPTKGDNLIIAALGGLVVIGLLLSF